MPSQMNINHVREHTNGRRDSDKLTLLEILNIKAEKIICLKARLSLPTYILNTPIAVYSNQITL